MPAFGGALLLGSLILSGQFLGAVARPPHSFQVDKREIVLSNATTCNEVQTYQKDNGQKRITADMFDKLECSKTLDLYLFANIGVGFTSYTCDFAAPWGVGQTFSCLLPDGCPRINCADLQDPNAVGSGGAYAILLSFANFNQYMIDLWNALNLSKDDWNGVQVLLQQTYWPNDPPPILLKELLVGITAIVGIIGAASGVIGAGTAAVTGSAAALLGGVLGGINAALSASDQSLANLALLEANTQIWYQTIFDALEWTNNNLTEKAQYIAPGVAAGLNDIIAKGAWLDYTDHPILNDDTSKPRVDISSLKQALYYYLVGNMVNFAWKSQGTFIAKYDMTEDEFNDPDTKWPPGNGDVRFRTYYGGSAFFLQRYGDDQDPLFNEPQSQYPPGWGDVAKDLAGCDPACVMRSSADAYHMAGFGFNFSTTATDYTSDQATALGWLTDLPRAPGFWNIPICELTGGPIDSVDKLTSALEDQNFSYDLYARKALWCYCIGNVDGGGKKFSDYVPKTLVDLFDKSLNCDEGYDPWKA